MSCCYKMWSDKTFFSGSHKAPDKVWIDECNEIPEEILNQYRRAYCDDKPTPATTLTGTPKPPRFPFRLENIELIEIERP